MKTETRKAAVGKRHELIRHIISLVIGFGVLYTLCHNGCWLPVGSDDAFHLEIARNLALDRGLTANGAPVIHTPPAFPALLSLVMRVTPAFSVLNGVLVILMLGAVVMWYLVLRRYTSPSKALAVMLVVGILFEWHRFAYTHYTEPLSYVLLAAAMLLAVQLGDGMPAGWRTPLLGLLCAAMVLANWRGLLSVILVGGALFSGRNSLRSRRNWAVVLLIALVSGATMIITFHTMENLAERVRAQGDTQIQRERAAAALRKQAERLPMHLSVGPKEALRRVSEAGEWISGLLWPPVTAARKWPVLELAVNLVGWLLIAIFLLRVGRAIRSREWIWIGTAGFLAVLIAIRWYPLPRYIAPAGPLILLGMWDGLSRLAHSQPFSGAKRVVSGCAVAALISVILCNALILAVHVWLVQSPGFHRKYLAGEYLDTLRISAYLRQQECGGGPVALLVRYADLNRSHKGRWADRAFSFMTDCRLLSAPEEIRSMTDPEFMDWAENLNMRYVVTRPEKLETRFWHFRETLFESAEGNTRAPFYLLFDIRDSAPAPVRLPRVRDGLRQVPGIS